MKHAVITIRPLLASAMSTTPGWTISLLAPFALVLVLASAGAGAERPNFVWLISEDNSKHYMKLFDENGAPTPEIEKLAEHGLVFEHAFSNSPVCSVARTTLITGCYAPRIGTQYHRRSVMVPMPRGVRMFPAYLRDAGYYTTNNKKKDYNAIEGRGVWDESSGKATWRNRKPGQPFFHKQSFPVTHESSLHFSEKTMKGEKTITNPATVFVNPNHPRTPTFRYTYARYHDRIRQMDALIGGIVDQLEEDGLLEDTFVFYFGDHGGVLPGSKGYVYESGIHVPLVVRVPENWAHLVDAKIGSRVGGFVSFIDFGPTLLNLASIDVPEGVDGRPFLGKNVSMDEVNRRDEAFGYADRFDEKYDLVRTLRKGRFKYMRNYQPFNFDGLQNDYRYKMLAYAEWRELYRAGKLNRVQSRFFEGRAPEALYDLDADPHETKNLASDPDHARVLADLRRRLADRVKGMPDLSLFPESYLVDEAFENPTAFGRSHKARIGRLVDVADLSLVPFGKARSAIEAALSSADPWRRYWGLIVCSAHRKSAMPLVGKAKALAADDAELLVRARAAEFLALVGAADPGPVLEDVLLRSESTVEANLILNTAVLLRDGKPGYKFSFPRGKIVGNRPGSPKDRYVNARLDYVNQGGKR
jgi:arylsulfatase A-like enzyme